MHGVDAPVQYLIGVEQEARDVARGSVVRACSRIALAESNRHPAILDRTGKAAISDLLELVVPASQRHPHLEADIGCRSRL